MQGHDKKNILWLSHFVPYPPVGGNYQRSYNLLREISRLHNIYLLAIKHKKFTHPDIHMAQAKSELRRFCRYVEIIDVSSKTDGLAFYKNLIKSILFVKPFSFEILNSSKFKRLIIELTDKIYFDIIHYDSLGLAGYVDCGNDIPHILNHHDIESHKVKSIMMRESSLIKKMIYLVEAVKLSRYEKHYCKKFDLNIVVSELDRIRLKTNSPNLNTEIIDNGVDIQYFSPQFNLNNENVLIFAGRLDSFSNKEGMLFFCKQVWPLLKRKKHDLRFIIIGKNPPRKLINLAKTDESIELRRYVDDVRPFFASATLFVCFIRSGGGTRIKILDALSMAMPIVSTSIGCEGLDIEPDKDLIIADKPEEFAEEVLRIINNKGLRKFLSENARNKAVSRYSWDIIGENARQIYSNLDSMS